MPRRFLIAGITLVASLIAVPARADSPLPAALRDVRFEQRLNEQVPLDIPFQTSRTGKSSLATTSATSR